MFHVFFSWFVKVTGYFVYRFSFRTKIYYQNKKKQSRRIKGKAIVISNHTSLWDFAVMLFVFPFRLLRCVVAEVTFDKPFMKIFLSLFGAIRVDRNTQDYAFISKSVSILNKGGVIEIYPESRLPSETDEVLPLPFKPSAVYIALESNAPIIPIYTNGKYFCKERARVIIGEPINVVDMYDEKLSEKENIERINEYLRDMVIQLGYELERQSKK